MSGYLDGKQFIQANVPKAEAVSAISGRDEKTGGIIIKAVNTSSEPAMANFKIANANGLRSEGEAIVLTSSSPTDENFFEEPRRSSR